MPVKAILRWTSWIFAVMLISLVGGPFTDEAIAQGHHRQIQVPAPLGSITIPPLATFGVITSTIGDFDCFGYGVPAHPPLTSSPCGTLPDVPIQEVDDDPQTDILFACPDPTVITYTHTFTIPDGATVLGAVWTANLVGIERAKFATTITLDDLIPVPPPNTGPLGTVLVGVPIFGPLAAVLLDGEFVVKVTRGIGGRYAKCDEVGLDFSHLAVLVEFPPAP